jgi:hypothetical protein
MKRIIIGLLALLTVSSVGFASPLNDFSQGKVAIDISLRSNPDFKAAESNRAWPKTFNGKSNMEYDVAFGLGNNLAFQYRQADLKADYTENIYGNLATHNGTIATQDFNVMYKLNNNYCLFTGIKQVQEKLHDSGMTFESDTKTHWQFGITGQTKLGKSLNGYATIAAGEDLSAWKVGLSYEVNKNLDFNIFYAENKYNKVTHNSIISQANRDDKADYTVKGIGYGITYKF